MKIGGTYTKKGDDGTTVFFGSNKRYSKDSQLTKTLGALDEANSLIGICRAKISKSETDNINIKEILFKVQNNLFSIQAIVAGADIIFKEDEINNLETDIGKIETILPDIDSFLIPGENEVGALLDFARATVRRAEREFVTLINQNVNINKRSLAYINRLSTLLYVLARFFSMKMGNKEQSPKY